MSFRSSPLAAIARTVVQARAARPVPSLRHSTPIFSPSSSRLSPFTPRSYSTAKESDKEEPELVEGEPVNAEAEAKAIELMEQLEAKNKQIAELKDSRLRTLADFENLQKISTREKAQAKDFALTSFARELISSIDILSLALASIPDHKIVPGHADAAPDHLPNDDLVSLHRGVSLTKKEIERVLKRHGVVPFDPTGQQFDPNLHEALYQAPVPGKEPGSVLECQEIGYMIKDRLLRAAKVGVVLGQSE